MRKGCNKGPEDLKTLFSWPANHVDMLWADAEHGEDYRASFIKLFQENDIRVYDAFAGTCNASSSLKKAMLACAHKGGAQEPLM